MSATARRLVLDSFGGPEVLRLEKAPAPQPGAGEVAVAVEVAGVNFGDTMIRRGEYLLDVLPERLRVRRHLPVRADPHRRGERFLHRERELSAPRRCAEPRRGRSRAGTRRLHGHCHLEVPDRAYRA